MITSTKDQLCSNCGRSIEGGEWLCACGQLLRVDVLRHEKPSDRLDSGAFVTDKTAVGPTGRTEVTQAHDKRTEKFDPLDALNELFEEKMRPVPTGADLSGINLSPVELYLLSKVVDAKSMDDLRQMSGLKQVELSVVLLNLIRAGALSSSNPRAMNRAGIEGDHGESDVGRQRREEADREFRRYQEKLEAGDVNAASLHLKRSLALHARNATAEALQNHIETFVAACNGYYERARRLISQGRGGDAVAELNTALQHFPGEAGFHNLLSVAIMYHTRDGSLAREHLRRAIRLDPFNDAYRVNLQRLDAHLETQMSRPRA